MNVSLVILGCATGDPRHDTEADIEADLARLSALEIVEVGALVNDAADQAWACYGPCEGADQAIKAEQERQAARLATLADIAVAVVARDLAPGACDDATVAANLEALAALRIVEVGALLEAVPENNPDCYNLPCPEDEAAAEAITCERAAALDGIVLATEGI